MTKRTFYTVEPTRFSRAWWLGQGRNALWIALVTLLVWVYADVEFTKETTLHATVLLSTARRSDLVLRSPSRVKVRFKVQGPSSGLARLKQRLGDPNDPNAPRQGYSVIRYEVTANDKTLTTRDILNDDELIANEGLTVLFAQPASIQVKTERKIRREAPVKLDYTGAYLSKEPVVVPPKVGLYVPESDWQKILKIQPEPVLMTVKKDLRTVKSDQPFTVDIIPKIADVPVELAAASVRATVSISERTGTRAFFTPVEVLPPSAWFDDGTWKQYVLKKQAPHEWRAEVRVSGTREDLDTLEGRMKSGKRGGIVAYIVLKERHKKPVSWDDAEVQIHLPEDLKLTLEHVAPSKVYFRLEKLPGAPGGP